MSFKYVSRPQRGYFMGYVWAVKCYQFNFQSSTSLSNTLYSQYKIAIGLLCGSTLGLLERNLTRPAPNGWPHVCNELNLPTIYKAHFNNLNVSCLNLIIIIAITWTEMSFVHMLLKRTPSDASNAVVGTVTAPIAQRKATAQMCSKHSTVWRRLTNGLVSLHYTACRKWKDLFQFVIRIV